MPWEAGGPWWQRYAATCRAAITEPRATFSALAGGGLASPLSFGILSSVVGLSPLLALVPVVLVALVAMRTPSVDASMLAAIPCVMVFYPAMSFAYFTSIGLLFHALARLLGGRASLSDSLRAGLYSSAWEPISAAAMVVYCVPLLGALLVLGTAFGSAAWRTVALRAFGERTHRLSPERALLAAVLTSGFWLTLWLGTLAAVIGFAIYQRSNR